MNWPDIALKALFVVVVLSVAFLPSPRLYFRALLHWMKTAPAEIAAAEVTEGEEDAEEAPRRVRTPEEEARFAEIMRENEFGGRMRLDYPTQDYTPDPRSFDHLTLVTGDLLQAQRYRITESTFYCPGCLNTGFTGGIEEMVKSVGEPLRHDCGIWNENVKNAYGYARYSCAGCCGFGCSCITSEEADKREEAWAAMSLEARYVKVVSKLDLRASQPLGLFYYEHDDTVHPDAATVAVIAFLQANPGEWYIAAELRENTSSNDRRRVPSFLCYQILDQLVAIGLVQTRMLEEGERDNYPVQPLYSISNAGQRLGGMPGRRVTLPTPPVQPQPEPEEEKAEEREDAFA